MLQIKGLTYAIGERKLLNAVDWNISDGKRIALIGANGAGKTTLMRIIIGEIPLQAGTIQKPRDYKIGYLPQEEIALSPGSVLEQALAGHRDILNLEEEIYRIQNEIGRQPEPDRAKLNRLGELQSRYDILGGYRLEASAKKILAGLGFKNSDFNRPITELSGGWRMRVYLARLLLQEPDLLLLDEPTNHLDIPSLEWLEDYLQHFRGSLVIVSHDRYFIDRLATEIAELENGKLQIYTGNYHAFEIQKALQLEKLRQQWEQQQKDIARQQKFIERFRYKATKAAQVQSRIKQLARQELIELPEETPPVHFRIKVARASFKDVLRISNLFFRYEEDWVLKDIHLALYRGERMALIGVNGAGKTTLTRLIAGELKPQKGILVRGERVRIGYYAQHQVEQLQLENSIYDEVLAAAAEEYRPRIRDVLGIFRFSGDEILKKISVLSGGEKARVSLAKILVSPVNFLIMDEPTNHLDLKSKQALEEALLHYDGTLLLISHDRYFLDKLVTRVAELRDGHLTVFEGNYTDYLKKRQAVPEKVSGETSGSPKTAVQRRKEQKRREAEARQTISKERQALNKRIKALEEEIEISEKRLKEMEIFLANPENYQDKEKIVATQMAYRELQNKLPGLLEEWEKNHLRLEFLLEELSSGS